MILGKNKTGDDFSTGGTDRKRKILTAGLILASVLLVLLLGDLMYHSSERAIEQNYQTTYRVALRNSSRVLDMNLRSIVEIVRTFLNEDPIITVLKAGNPEQEKGEFSTAEQKSLETAAKKLAWQQAWVNDIAFFDLYGRHYMLSNTRGSYEFDQYYASHDFTEEAWYEKTRKADGKEVFFGENVLGHSDSKVLSMTKYLIDPDSGEGLGYLVVTLSRSLISKSYVGGNTSDPASNFMVLDTDDRLVYYDGSAKEEEAVREMFLNPSSAQSRIFSDVTNETTRWRLINAAEIRDLSRESRQLRVFVWLVGGGVLILIGLFANLLFMNQRLTAHLMATRLNEREAERLLLQSRINPHFLYNTLDALYFQAIIHGDDQIADMTMALSNHFKLTLNSGRNYITIRNSLQWMREYMKIMNMRFHDRFQLVEHVDETLLDQEILTFILQPFVENAMIHGLETKVGNGVITITVRREGDSVLLIIEDDGAGMEDISVWESGYGIQNVQQRIHLHYGNDYGAKVESERNKGTRVTVTLPLQTGV